MSKRKERIDFTGQIDYSYTMIKKIENYIRKYHMVQAGDTVAAGVSGGADSVCLLFVLSLLREKLGFRLLAVHVDHQIRKEAGEDAAYVRKLCERWDCPLIERTADVEGYARKRRISTEEAGRKIRYKAFQEALEEAGAPEGKIAVAHNQNDNAETILFHLFRGSGSLGLSGIHPVRGRIIRPLLCAERREIEAFLEENDIRFCIDRTNNEDTYTRNRIRHHILNYAEAEICGGAARHICEAGALLGETERYLEKKTEELLESCGERTGREILLSVEGLKAAEPFLARRALLLAMERLSGSRRDLGAVHARALYELAERKENGELCLPYQIRAYREYDKIRLTRGEKKEEGQQEVVLNIPGKQTWKEGLAITCSLFPYEKRQIIPRKTYTKWFDYDKIKESLVLRTRKSGDYLTIHEDGRTKTLKAYLIQEKIPRIKRDEIPVIAEGNHILWVIGGRSGEHCRIDHKTKTVLQIQVMGGTLDG